MTSGWTARTSTLAHSGDLRLLAIYTLRLRLDVHAQTSLGITLGRLSTGGELSWLRCSVEPFFEFLRFDASIGVACHSLLRPRMACTLAGDAPDLGTHKLEAHKQAGTPSRWIAYLFSSRVMTHIEKFQQLSLSDSMPQIIWKTRGQSV